MLEQPNCSEYGKDVVPVMPFHVFLPSTALTVLLISTVGSPKVKSAVPESETSTPSSVAVAVAVFVPPSTESRAAV